MTKKLKKEIKKLPKKFMAFTMIFAMLFSYFAPITNVFALSSTTKLSVSFRDGNEGYGKVQYSVNDGASWNDITENINLENLNVTGDNLRLKIVPNNNYSVDYAGIEMQQDENNIGGLSSIGLESANGYAIPSNVQSVSLNQVEFRAGSNGNNNQNNITSKVVVDVSGDDLEYGADWTDEEPSFVFGINGSQMNRILQSEVNYKTESNDIVGYTTKDEINYSYNYSGEETVTFNIRTQWDIVITSLIVNDDTYNTPRSKAALSSAYQGGGISFDVLNVPYAEKYEIEVVARKQTDEEKILGNFGWTYDPNTNDYTDDDKIPNGKLEFVEAKYNDITYNSIQDVNEAGGLFNWEDGVKGTNHPEGNATFPTGTELTIRLIPDSGYQLTSFDLNGFPFETGDEVGLYTFTIGGGNWHLGAHFTEVNDEVKPNSVNISSGSIDIAGGFENGTAKLEVNDVASMAPNRMEGFESKATDEGYDIENYLDISLYNSIYKGGKKDSSGNYESWDTAVENIDNKATITLELENDMSGKNLAIVHETHNGDEITGYELIDAIYNEENNIITFETNSFSKYAIVSKESTETTKYTVTFNSNGGSEIESKKVTAGNSVAEPTAPTNGDKVFDGWFEDETLTTRFDFNTPITSNVTLYAKWIDNEESDNSETEKYTITDSSGNVISFTEEKDREFTLDIIDYLTFSLEDLENAEIPKDMFDSMMEMVANATKNSGTLLSFYEIQVRNDDGYLIHEGPFNIKIKMTDEMKKYNTFKIIYVDADNNFATESPITLTMDGDYLVGTLDHLSTYALTGSNTSTTNNTNTTNNPQTGDNIYIWFGMLIISILGLSLGTFTAIKSKKSKNR